MGSIPPKKRRTARKQGLHRSHLLRELAERVNARSPVKVQIGSASRRRAKPAASSSK